ncbi:LAMI_0F01838g1_1 [Lachancea mirantina]|uniref:Sterol 3-beta-glucosyltransferase n=1 Tax=Lachancea mirantina TaxID=1230905 RepID=A0A1G4JW58_9SACH|nr:LAMI_0F01838g1_1 [Lachancea mirantina]
MIAYSLVRLASVVKRSFIYVVLYAINKSGFCETLSHLRILWQGVYMITGKIDTVFFKEFCRITCSSYNLNELSLMVFDQSTKNSEEVDFSEGIDDTGSMPARGNEEPNPQVRPLRQSMGSLNIKDDLSPQSDNFLEDELGRDQEDDVARPCGMAKSIVGLLTTASVYAGMGGIDEGQIITEVEDDRKASSGDGLKGDNRQEDDDELAGSMSLSEDDTLFELAIVPTFAGHSNATDGPRSRHSKIYKMLFEKFELDPNVDQMLCSYSCWLLRDVLIQGHIILTECNLLFFAFLPKHDGKTKMSGNLSIVLSIGLGKKRISRYWAVLKDHTLSFFGSPKDLYFPVMTIDLRYAQKVDLCRQDGSPTTEFKIVLENKVFKFKADSDYACRSWCNGLRKQIFAVQNAQDDSLSIKIPLENIVDIDKQKTVADSFTLRIRVLESTDSYAVDDYFLMFLNNSGALLKTAVDKQLANLEMSGSNINFGRNLLPQPDSLESPFTFKDDDRSEAGRGRTIESRRSIFKQVLSPCSRKRDHTQDTEQSPSRSPLKVKERIRSMTDSFKGKQLGKSCIEEDMDVQYFPIEKDSDKSSDEAFPEVGNSMNSESEEAENELDNEAKEEPHFKLINWTPRPIKHMGNMWGAHPVHYLVQNLTLFPEDDKYIAGAKESQTANSRFREHFSLDENESLIAAYYTYLNKNIPIYGKLYVGKSKVCFRSLIPGTKTKMILPIEDMENCYKERGFRFGYFGLVLVIQGHEELFFEFSLRSSRDDAEFIMLKRLDSKISGVKKSVMTLSAEDVLTDQLTKDRALSRDGISKEAKLKLFEDKINAEGYDLPLMIEDNPYYKTSITPKKAYKFGLLTIGSRGDVQPYIALGKGLQKEGHKVTIITHAEFGSWIQSHGIAFREIAGNPAELMALMVQHGSMNVGMLRKASTHFRGWIQELLDTAWEACQNIDILIESPSAMAGIHIAEALNLPYFRAFTMPWTRTRAYPHAFIVPDQKRGGNYNYLTHVLFENIFWKGISGQVNKWRVETLGLEKTNLDLMQQNKVPFLYNISPSIFPPSVDFSEWVKVTGYWFLDEKIDFKVSDELRNFISEARTLGKKLVYIGFGSIVVTDPREMTKAVVDAVVSADVYCILNKGWSERLSPDQAHKVEVGLPACVFNSGSIPHDWLFPQIDAAVHHGGSGTTGAALRAGLPSVIKPFFGDQFFFAGRVEDIGAGISLKKLNSKSLGRALKEVTTNSRLIGKAQQIQKEISNQKGVDTAIGCIYSELEYARSLTTNKANEAKRVLKVTSSPLDEEGSWLMI